MPRGTREAQKQGAAKLASRQNGGSSASSRIFPPADARRTEHQVHFIVAPAELGPHANTYVSVFWNIGCEGRQRVNETGGDLFAAFPEEALTIGIWGASRLAETSGCGN